MDTKKPGLLLVLSGPSGAGKGTICKELRRVCPKMKYSVSATTRPTREGEVDGESYFFVNSKKFVSMINNDEMLEYAEVYGNYYGTPKKYVDELLLQGHDVILEIDPQGAFQVRKKIARAVFVFILPPSLEELADRIYQRGTDAEEVIRERLNMATSELECAPRYDYFVVNDDVTTATQKIVTILEAEKLKAERNLDVLKLLARKK